MADEAKIGTIWQTDDLDAIVADHFAMLAADLAGRPYVKSKHSKELMARIGRTHRSIEFKHQNISAVMDELGMPWIPGYMPKRNYRMAIFDAIDRYLSRHEDILESLPIAPIAAKPLSEVFVPEPPLMQPNSDPASFRIEETCDPLGKSRLVLGVAHALPARQLDLLPHGPRPYGGE